MAEQGENDNLGEVTDYSSDDGPVEDDREYVELILSEGATEFQHFMQGTAEGIKRQLERVRSFMGEIMLAENVSIIPDGDDPGIQRVVDECGFGQTPKFTLIFSSPDTGLPVVMAPYCGKTGLAPHDPFPDEISCAVEVSPPPSKKDCTVEVVVLPSQQKMTFLLEVPPEAKNPDAELREKTRSDDAPAPRSMINTGETCEISRTESGIRIELTINDDSGTLFVLEDELPMINLR